jgi:hypothetical protein
LYVVYIQTVEQSVPAAVNSNASAMLATGRRRKELYFRKCHQTQFHGGSIPPPGTN